MTFLSHFLIPKFLSRERRSAIINLSSVAGENPIPFISTYSATKAYNDFFSQATQMEYAYKIDILSVRPMYVETGLSKMEKSCTVASARECVQAVLKYIGVDYETNGFYMHRFLSYLTSYLPTPVLRCVAESESRKIMEAQNNSRV
jgi:short-subunit dehydrogenase